MSRTDDAEGASLARERLAELLERLDRHGITQQQAALQAGVPPQYLSDIRHGRRPMTELVARRLGERWGVPYTWLRGRSAVEEPAGAAAGAAPTAAWLPVFPHPIEGDPRNHPRWDGLGVEIAGAARPRLAGAEHPYVLRFGHDDVRARLHQGDLILVSQAASTEAEIQVVRARQKLFLARRAPEGGWERVANGSRLPPTCPTTGHCLGIVWAEL